MLRLTLFPILLLLGSVFLGLVSYYIYRKIRHGVRFTVEKGTTLVKQQQQKWAKKEQRKKLPEILQKGFDDYDKLLENHSQLSEEWKTAINPLLSQVKEILDEVAEEATQSDKERGIKRNSIRNFFNHTLDALVLFTQKLKDEPSLNSRQIEKARQNIVLFKAELLRHQQKLQKSRRFDFDVMMDVIKARLKK